MPLSPKPTLSIVNKTLDFLSGPEVNSIVIEEREGLEKTSKCF